MLFLKLNDFWVNKIVLSNLVGMIIYLVIMVLMLVYVVVIVNVNYIYFLVRVILIWVISIVVFGF